MPPPGVREARRSNLSKTLVFQLTGKTANISAPVHLSLSLAAGMYCIINNNKQAQSKAVIESLHFADSGKKKNPLSELQHVYIIWMVCKGNMLGVIKVSIPPLWYCCPQGTQELL